MANDLLPYGGNTSLTGGGVFDDINHSRPDLSPLLLANQASLLTPRNLQGIAAYRELGNDEKTSGMKIIAITNKLPSDETLEYMTRIQELGATIRTGIKTEGTVEINRKQQSSESWREFLRQVGGYSMIRIQQKQQTERTRLHEEGENFRTQSNNETQYVIANEHETGLTERLKIEQEGTYAIQRLKLHADVRLMKEYVNGQIHLSDNQLEATRIEAIAIRDSILGTERIRAATQRRISKDELIKIVKQEEFKYLTEMGKAEYLWRTESKKMNTDLLKSCLAYHSELFRAQLEYQVELAKAEEKKERNGRKVFEALYGFLETIDLDNIMSDLLRAGRKVKGVTIQGRPLDPDFKLSLRIDED